LWTSSLFAAYVGGSPTNIAVGRNVWDSKTAVLTAVGEDPVADFILKFLNAEGVETRFIPRKPGTRTSAVVLGIEPPDKFPLVYYRDNCADNQLSIDDVLKTPVGSCRVFEFSGTGLSREPSRSANLFAVEQAKAAGATVVLDVDFRPNQWHDARAFGVVVRSVLPLVDIVLGTDDECKAVTLTDPTQVNVTHSQISGAQVAGDLHDAVQAMQRRGPATIVVKRGEKERRFLRPARRPWRSRFFRSKSTTSSARATRSRRDSSMASSKVGIFTKPRGWAMRAVRLS